MNEDERAVLACDIASRPDAPGIDAVAAFVRSARRDAAAVVVEFDPRGAETVRAFVEAERVCCAELGWLLDERSGVRLSVVGTPEQLDIIEGMFASPADR